MTYSKNIWKNGDTITAEKLNNIEDGIADSMFVEIPCTVSEGSSTYYTLGKTWQEIYDLLQDGKILYFRHSKDFTDPPSSYSAFSFITIAAYTDARVYEGSLEYVVTSVGGTFRNASMMMNFKTTKANGYPTTQS